MKKKIAFSLQNNLDELETLRHKVEQYGVTNGLPDKTVFELNLILDELFTNIVTCGYRDRNVHWVNITISIEKNLLAICVEDDGTPFNPVAVKEPDVGCSIEKRQIGGLGIHLIRHMTDSISYRRLEDRNVITMTKIL